MGKYDALCRHLMGLDGDEWQASFDDIERVLGFELPFSARHRYEWWAQERNPRQPQKLAYQRAGWRVAKVSMKTKSILFRRIGPSADVPKTEAPSSTLSTTVEPPVSLEPEKETRVSVRFAWQPVGKLKLDERERLVFPKAPVRPGLYRFKLECDTTSAVYIGETDELARRLQHYRTPGPSQKTNRRLNQRMRQTLDARGRISVAIVINATWLAVNGEEREADLSKKADRVLLEHAALVACADPDVEILNL